MTVVNSSPIICPLCAADVTKRAWHVRSNADGVLNDSFEVYVCSQCGVGLTHPVPPPAELASYYQAGIYKKSGGRLNALVDGVLNRLCDQRLKQIAAIKTPPGRFLDVGCGKGRLLARAARAGWQVEGTDASPGQVAAAYERYRVKVSLGELSEIGFEANSFDVITAWHMLEHVPSPDGFMQEVSRILRPGGLLVLEVPNFASWQARLGGQGWFHSDVPRHLVHYSPPVLQSLMADYGLRPVQLSTFSLEMGPFGMLESLLNRVGLPPNWLFGWLKRTRPATSRSATLLNLTAAGLMVGPALGLEIVAGWRQRGGIVRLIAVKS